VIGASGFTSSPVQRCLRSGHLWRLIEAIFALPFFCLVCICAISDLGTHHHLVLQSHRHALNRLCRPCSGGGAFAMVRVEAVYNASEYERTGEFTPR